MIQHALRVSSVDEPGHWIQFQHTPVDHDSKQEVLDEMAKLIVKLLKIAWAEGITIRSVEHHLPDDR